MHRSIVAASRDQPRPASPRRVVREPPHRGGDGGRVGRIEGQIRRQQFADRRGCRARDRHPAAVGFEDRQAEPFVERRIDEHRRVPEEPHELAVGHVARADHRAGWQAERVGEPPQAGDPLGVQVADDRQLVPGMVVVKPGEGPHEAVEVLAPVAAADAHAVGADESVPAGHVGRVGGRPRYQGPLRVVDVAAEGVDPAGVDAGMPDHVGAGAAADPEEVVAAAEQPERLAVAAAGRLPGEIAVGEQPRHEVVDHAEPARTLRQQGRRDQGVGVPGGRRQEEAGGDDGVDPGRRDLVERAPLRRRRELRHPARRGQRRIVQQEPPAIGRQPQECHGEVLAERGDAPVAVVLGGAEVHENRARRDHAAVRSSAAPSSSASRR
jgi:hypothetical protein